MTPYATRLGLGIVVCMSLGCAATEAKPETPSASAAGSASSEAPEVTDADAKQTAEPVTMQPAKPRQPTPAAAGAASAAPSSKPPTAGTAASPSAGAAAPSSKPAPDAGSGEPDTGKGKGGTAQSDGKLSAFIEISDVPSGAEAHRCVVVELPNTEAVWASEFHATLTNGSHHMIVDRFDSGVEVVTEAKTCSPAVGGDATRLMIAQQHDTKLELPEGVAFKLEPKQHIYLQMHYINATTKPVAIKGTIELTLAPKATTPIEAKSVFTGSTSITLPAHQAGESKYFQVLPADPAWNVFAMTSHTHQLGVHATIERVAAADAPETKPLHESRDWAEPPLSVFDKPLLFDGKDGLRLTCRYMNTTDRDVHFGTGVEDEMCFMWVYYFVNEAKAQQ